jgi:NAD(P)-dependent dehydrogenase (short-subunit alcohol dehydrogenase family)
MKFSLRVSKPDSVKQRELRVSSHLDSAQLRSMRYWLGMSMASSVSKASLVMFVRNWSAELKPEDITAGFQTLMMVMSQT